MNKMTLSAKSTEIALSKNVDSLYNSNDFTCLDISKKQQIYTHIIYIKIDSQYGNVHYLPLEFIKENEVTLEYLDKTKFSEHSVKMVVIEYKMETGQLIQTTKDYMMKLINKNKVFVTGQTKGSDW